MSLTFDHVPLAVDLDGRLRPCLTSTELQRHLVRGGRCRRSGSACGGTVGAGAGVPGSVTGSVVVGAASSPVPVSSFGSAPRRWPRPPAAGTGRAPTVKSLSTSWSASVRPCALSPLSAFVRRRRRGSRAGDRTGHPPPRPTGQEQEVHRQAEDEDSGDHRATEHEELRRSAAGRVRGVVQAAHGALCAIVSDIGCSYGGGRRGRGGGRARSTSWSSLGGRSAPGRCGR